MCQRCRLNFRRSGHRSAMSLPRFLKMPKTLPAPIRRNAPWTPLQRRTWLAERRRRGLPHLLPGPTLRAVFPEKAEWSWPYADPYRWYVLVSSDGGVAFELENWQDGSARRYAPDGGGEPMFVVGVDGDGNEITERSNVIVPEDALFPAPVLAPEFPEKAVWTWDYTNPIRWNVYISFDGGINYQLIDWEDGDARRYAPDGGGDPLFIVGVDATGKEITERSNIIVPEDALMPAPVLVATYPDKAEWSWDLPDPYRWTVYLSFDGGISFKQWDWQAGDERRYAPDGGGNPMFIFGVDGNGKKITERSNVIIPDEAEPPATLLTDLTGYWPLDEGTDVTRLDATVNAQTLFDLNSDFPGGTGVVGGAATSDAEGLYRQLSADLVAPFSGSARSVSWWVNPSSAPSENFQIFLSLDGGDYTNDCVQCYAHGGGEFNVEFFGPWAAMIHDIIFDSWNHLVATSDGTTARLYFNGVEYATGTPNPSSPLKLWVGNYYGMDRSMAGAMDEIGLWNRCLTADDVALLYNSGAGLSFELFT